MSITYLLIGSNQNDRLFYLKSAFDLINESSGKIISYSSIYETEPWGNKDQPYFLNMVIGMNTRFSPELLLDKIHLIENTLERVRSVKWGIRTIDIDILLFDDVIINKEFLIIPHPLLCLRRFVLMPLSEIIATYIHPVLNKEINLLLDQCDDKSKVIKTNYVIL